jgi:hypothetical protein
MKRIIGNWYNDTVTTITIANGTITERQELNAMHRMGAPLVSGKLRLASVQGGGIDPYTEFDVISPIQCPR